MRKWILAGIYLVIVAWGGRARGEGYEEIRREETSALVAELGRYADWCSRNKLFAERARVYRLVLQLEPDHAEARRMLGFRRAPGGGWEETPSRREPRDFDAGALRRAPAERAKAIQPYCDHLLALLEAETLSAAREKRLSADERERLLEDVLLVDPDNARAHEIRGEVKLAEAWVLRETAAAKARRAEIKAFVRAAYREAPAAQRVEPNARESALGLPLKGVETPLLRVLGTGGEEELRKSARALEAAKALFERLFATRSSYPEDFTVFLLAGRGEGESFLAAHPAVSDAMRGSLASFDGAGIPGTGDFVHWSEDERRRRDAAVRFAISWLFAVAFGTSTEEGWVHEGFGLYLTREAAGTRLSWFAQPSHVLGAEEETALRARLLDDETNWMNEAWTTLQRKGRASLASVMEKKASELTPEDMLFAYVTAAYLLEGRTVEETSRLLRLVGAGVPGPKAVQQALGTTVDALDARIVRWLSERR